MTELEAIRIRRSRRHFTGAPTQEELALLQDRTHRLAAESGLALRLLEDSADLFGGFSKTYGLFSGVSSFFLLAGSAADAGLNEKAGYYGQQLVLKATRMGLGTCWVGGTFNRAVLANTLLRGQALVAVIPVGPVREMVGVRERLVYSVARRRGKTVQEMCALRDGQEPPAWFWEGVRAAARAPSALNRQPVVFGWENGQASASVGSPDTHEGIDLGIAKLHFEIAAGGSFAPGNGAAFTKSPPQEG